MGNRQVTGGGTHRATTTHRKVGGRRRRRERGTTGVKAMMSAVGVAGAALAGAALIGVAPSLSVSPQLAASLHYLRGTNIGGVPSEQEFQDFIRVVIDGSGTTPPDEPYEKVPYNAGFKPFSHGGFDDLTYNESVQQGVELLAGQQPAAGDVIFGYSQGAVVASLYKQTHTGNTYLLVANPSRPNGGVMQRFSGLTIPFLDVTFTGATPDNGVDGAPGGLTVDVVRQYDGWADFPRYLWNPIAIANAVMGITLVHSGTQTELTAADLAAAKASGDSDYYQYHAGSNTHYYVIKTYPIPLLMPLDPFLSDSAIAALDAPLRKFIETAYDRTDYSTPARASLFKPFGTAQADVPTARIADESDTEPERIAPEEDQPQPGDGKRAGASYRDDAEVSEALDTEADEQLDLESAGSVDPEEGTDEDGDAPGPESEGPAETEDAEGTHTESADTATGDGSEAA